MPTGIVGNLLNVLKAACPPLPVADTLFSYGAMGPRKELVMAEEERRLLKKIQDELRNLSYKIDQLSVNIDNLTVNINNLAARVDQLE